MSESTFSESQKTVVPQSENTPVTYCSSCNVEMSQTKTMLKINGWQGPNPKLGGDDSSKVEELPVLVCLCPQCGKIEFRADKN